MKATKKKPRYIYTVYDNKTGFPIAVNKTSNECAKQMGISMTTFYNVRNRSKNGTNKRWTILRYDECDQACLNDVSSISNLPSMVRVAQIAKCLQTTSRCILKLCEKLDVPVVRGGASKTRFVSRDKFLAKMEQEAG